MPLPNLYDHNGYFLALGDSDARAHFEGKGEPKFISDEVYSINVEPLDICRSVKNGSGLELMAVHSLSEKPGIAYVVAGNQEDAVALAKELLPQVTAFYVDRNPLILTTPAYEMAYLHSR